MDWITDNIAIGTCLEKSPEGCAVLDLRRIPDHQRISQADLDLSVGFIRSNLKAGRRVFVHCIGGVSRSPSIVAAYIATAKGITAEQAFQHIKAKRSIIEPHPSQVVSVKEYVERIA